MGAQFHDAALLLALVLVVALVAVTGYRIAVHRAVRRLHGRSTRDRERNLPTILRIERWLKQARLGKRRRRRSGSRRKER